jgi:outer membrane protein
VQVERDLLAARESVTALTESQRIARDMLAVGKIARLDLLKVDTRVADLQAQVISLTDEREILAGQLNALLGRAVDTPVSVQQDLPSAAPAPVAEDAANQAVSASTQYALANAELVVTQSSLALARAQLRPELSFSAMAFGQSFDPFSVYRGGAVAGFSFRYPLFDRPAQEKVQEAKSAELESRSRTEQARLDAMQRARTAALQVHDAQARAAATESSIEEAGEALRIEQEKQRYGRETMEHLLDAQVALLAAQANYYRALADETIATAALKRETGK